MALIDDGAVDAFTHKLLPNAFLVTPNLHEAAKLTSLEITDVRSMEQAAAAIARFGVANVLVKGGHLDGDAVDVLWTEGQTHILSAPRVDTRHTHGTGCVLSAAITVRLAKGEGLVAAVKAAKQFITAAICTNPGLGAGSGPVNLHSGTDF